jgi:hypothetical protein
MIELRTLTYLATQKRKDSEVLYERQRYNGAVYMMGYSLELSLKRALSLTLDFKKGFPETNNELKAYETQLAKFNSLSTGITLFEIAQIRNHDLVKLVKFSGRESFLITSYLKEWTMVCNWNPGMRYMLQNWTSARTNAFMSAASTILKHIR